MVEVFMMGGGFGKRNSAGTHGVAAVYHKTRPAVEFAFHGWLGFRFCDPQGNTDMPRKSGNAGTLARMNKQLKKRVSEVAN
jgi:hypothetical protein